MKDSQPSLIPAIEQDHSINQLANSKGVIPIQRRRALKSFDLGELMAYLESVNLNQVEAKLNEVSMDDNNGGRILY